MHTFWIFFNYLKLSRIHWAPLYYMQFAFIIFQFCNFKLQNCLLRLQFAILIFLQRFSCKAGNLQSAFCKLQDVKTVANIICNCKWDYSKRFYNCLFTVAIYYMLQFACIFQLLQKRRKLLEAASCNIITCIDICF